MPPAADGWGPEVVGLAASAGLILDPGQADVLYGALGQAEDDRWVAPEVAVVEPRQNGKGSILEARALGGLFQLHEPLILWTAHEFKTSREGFLRVRALIDNTDHLRKRVKAIRMAAGEEGIELLDGCRLRFIARSGGSGRGFSGACLLLDEAYALTDDQMAALLPTLSAQPNTQIWYTSSAPLPTSTVLRRICLRGRAGSEGLAYFEWCAADDARLDDRQAWAEANPAYGIRIEESSILRELGAMGPEEFKRERLGIVDLENALEQVIAPALWNRLADPTSAAMDPVLFAVDTSPDRRSTAIGAAGRRADGLGHVEVVEHRSGSGWVVDRVAQLVGRWSPLPVVVDPASPAGAFIADLEARGVEVMKLSARDAAHAHEAFRNDAINERFRHLSQPELNAALAGAATRDLADAKAWSRKNSSADISPLVAVTNAAYGFAVHGPDEYDVLDSAW